MLRLAWRTAVLAALAMLASAATAAALIPADGGGGSTRVGGPGPDLLKGGASADHLQGLGGDDRLYGRRGPDVLEGGPDADRLYGGRGNDALHGGRGGDAIFGEQGADRILAGPGNDLVYVGRGRDYVEGGPGDDILFAKSGRDVEGRHDRDGDRVRGGAGNDRIVTRDGERDEVSCGDGSDAVAADFKDSVEPSCEQVERRAALGPPAGPNRRAGQAVVWAVRQAGTCEQPLGSNRGPQVDQWERRAGFLGAPWCGIFIHEAYFRAGLDLDNGMASTDWIREAAEAEGGRLVQIPLSRARRGDLVLFDFVPGDGDPDSHVGLVRGAPLNGAVPTIEGNTSDCVRKHNRSAADVVMAVRIRS
jgi:RTX calcium-binding nonapeptide repeat (4 copies)